MSSKGLRKVSQLGVLVSLLMALAAGCGSKVSPTPAPLMTTPEVQDTASPTPSIVPTQETLPTGLIRIPVPDSARHTAAALLSADRPPTDYYRVAVQIKGLAADQLASTPPAAGDLKVNDRANFFVAANLSSATRNYKSIPTRLRYLSDHAAWWASVDADVSDEEIAAAAKRFEETIIPINQELFGREWSPGIDGDERIHILFIQEPGLENAFGYFSNVNEYPQSIFSESNGREMFVINLGGSKVDSEAFAGELAHEYQHLIHWNQDQNEDHWFNESMGELVTLEGGKVLGESNAVLFSENPDIQLTSRPERATGEQSKIVYAHYAAERLFAVYLLEQFGAEFIHALVRNPAPGVIAIQEELDKLPGKPRFDDVYATWLLANFLDMPGYREGQFGYQNLDPISPLAQVLRSIPDEPLADRLPPYGAHYYQINSDQDVKVQFAGSTLARLTPADPPGGGYVWYSTRGDESDFSLTRTFDLSGLEKATLNYQVWYELEQFFDYAYVEVSTDGGEHWEVLQTAYGTDDNPNNLAYGEGYTGSSNEWLSESLDLSPYSGQVIQVRFEVITDFTTNQDGLQIDNLEIPELGFFDGAEDDQAGWEAQGFVRSTNFVPVNWVAWVVKPSPVIEWIEVQPDQSAEFEISGFGVDFDFALLIVSPTAAITTEKLNYELIFKH